MKIPLQMLVFQRQTVDNNFPSSLNYADLNIMWHFLFSRSLGMRAPSFRCTEGEDGTLILHYYSDRDGLEHIVIGIVKVRMTQSFFRTYIETDKGLIRTCLTQIQTQMILLMIRLNWQIWLMDLFPMSVTSTPFFFFKFDKKI